MRWLLSGANALPSPARNNTYVREGGSELHLVDVVAQELGEQFGVKGLLVVDGHVGLLLQDVVESRRPLAAAQARGVRAVVHHECNAARVHVRVQRVHSLQDRITGASLPVESQYRTVVKLLQACGICTSSTLAPCPPSLLRQPNSQIA